MPYSMYIFRSLPYYLNLTTTLQIIKQQIKGLLRANTKLILNMCSLVLSIAIVFKTVEAYCGEGGRGKAERARGRAGSETSGETVGK